ncbi:MAG TPA: exonuclease SbcCD subunit D [Herpetosiphonaceae bacterium]
MPKVLHLADIHIGMENYGHLNPQTGLHSRLEDYLRRFDEVLDYIFEHEPVDLVLIAGDIYKNRTPNPTHQREFARRVNRIVRAGLPVFILTGNHDAPAANARAHSVEIFDTLEIERVTIASKMRVHLIDTQRGPLQMIAIPWLNRQALLTKDEMIGLPMGALEVEMLSRVSAFIESTLERLDPDIPTVLSFHGTVGGATYGAERSVMLGHDLVVPSSLLAAPGIDYVALGHIHKHQAIGSQPPVVYPGSIERIDFGEEHEAKGFVIAHIEKGNTSWRFVEVSARPFVTVRVDVRQHADAQERIRRAIAKHHLQDAIVRVLIDCTLAQRQTIDERAIRVQVEETGAHVVAAIALEVERSSRGRFAEVAEQVRDGLTPQRALELYLQTKNVPAERQARLLQAAAGLMQREI